LKIKCKGAYEYENLDWHKNHSALIIPKAAVNFLVYGTPIESFIRNHKDHLDFMLRVRVPRSNKLLTVDDFGVETKEQNVCRYYVSTNGSKLMKIMPALDKPGKIATVWQNEQGEETLTYKDSEVKKANKLGFTINKGQREIPLGERPQEIEAGWKVTICNKLKDFSGNINYDYYISETRKLVDCYAGATN
jgi:hypothetical protein